MGDRDYMLKLRVKLSGEAEEFVRQVEKESKLSALELVAKGLSTVKLLSEGYVLISPKEYDKYLQTLKEVKRG